jgi:hypothetical protein
MKKRFIAALGVALLLAFAGLVLPSFAHGDDDAGRDEIAKANAEIQRITGECIADLKKADSAAEMDEIAAECEEEILEVIDELEEELGYEVEVEISEVCVTNEKLDYTVCFDPIHVGGSGRGGRT